MCHDDPIVEEDYFGVHTLRFSADGRQLIVGSANTSVRVSQYNFPKYKTALF